MDQGFTDYVITSMGPKTTPKARRILSSLIQHIHGKTILQSMNGCTELNSSTVLVKFRMLKEMKVFWFLTLLDLKLWLIH